MAAEPPVGGVGCAGAVLPRGGAPAGRGR